MNMIRNVMFGISLLALSGSAIAAPAVKAHASKPRVVAQAGDTAAPADKPAKKEKKHTGGKKGTKGDAAKTEGAKEMKAAPEKTATPETK
jgi:hypothetical protein